MTFCIGIQVRDGIVALADTRIVRGSEQTSKLKLAEFPFGDRSLFTMTSGLRSVRDKTIRYLDESLQTIRLTSISSTKLSIALVSNFAA
jgi:putative proteasome-type protease